MNSSLTRRVIEAIAATLIAVFAVSGYLGLRAVVWRQEFMVAAMIQSGIVVSALVAGMIGVIHTLVGSWAWRVLKIDWMSIQFGAILGAALYGGYNAITPLSPFSQMEPPVWRALQGGVDGLLIGAALGAAVMFISGRALRFDRYGLQRYLILYVTVVLVAWVILLIENLIHFSDVVGIALILPLLLILRLVVIRLDRHYTYDDGQDYGYEDGG